MPQQNNPPDAPVIVSQDGKVTIGGGQVQSENVRRARGHAERPLADADLFEKFRTCLDAGHARISPEALFERLRTLEAISARELTAVA